MMLRSVPLPRLEPKLGFWRYCGAVKECRLYFSSVADAVADMSRYDETVDMLYRENTFYIENPRTLLELPSSLSPARLSSFRHLYLESARYGEYTPADRLDKWAAVVGVLKRLDGLETLVVILRPMYGLEWEVRG
jgi:hypothetical protein